MNESETPSTAAEIRALAEQAEVEAAEAEALAAAARARARAMHLRRQAELVEAKSAAAATADAKAETSAKAAPSEDAAAQDLVGTQAEPTAESETQQTPADAVDAAGAVAEPDADTADQPARPRRRLSSHRRPKWSSLAAGLAVVVTLAALAGSGYMIKAHRDAVLQRQRAAEFSAAAREGVVTLTSLDFSNAKQGVQRIVENATGSFKDDFLKTADDFTKVVEQSKVVSQGTVQASAVDMDTITNDSAVVLVAATQEVTNAAGAKRDPRNYRLIVTVARDGGQLKISKVEFVP